MSVEWISRELAPRATLAVALGASSRDITFFRHLK